jgi:hypothetical protein
LKNRLLARKFAVLALYAGAAPALRGVQPARQPEPYPDATRRPGRYEIETAEVVFP